MSLREGLDLVDELRLRRWARENYMPVELRDDEWHPVVLDEMSRRDAEAALQGDAVILPAGSSQRLRRDASVNPREGHPHFARMVHRAPTLAPHEMHYY